MMTSPSVSASRRLSLKSMIQAAAAVLTGTRAAVVSEPQDRRHGSRWTNHTQKRRNGAKAKARRKTAHKSRRRNRAA